MDTKRQIISNRALAVLGVAVATGVMVMSLAAPKGLGGVNEQPRFMDVVTLAERIRDGEALTLIDLRSEKAYEEFHLPAAVNIPMDDFCYGDMQEGVMVFYSGDDLFSRQVWEGMPDTLRDLSYVLYGGVHDWYRRVLYPELPARPVPGDTELLEQVHDLSLFYGGQADFVQDAKVMDYYRMELKQAAWPKQQRKERLARRGC